MKAGKTESLSPNIFFSLPQSLSWSLVMKSAARKSTNVSNILSGGSNLNQSSSVTLSQQMTRAERGQGRSEEIERMKDEE